MKKIVIIGAGGFGREVAWMIDEMNKKEPRWNILGFLDDDHTKLNEILNGYKVLGNLEYLNSMDEDVQVVCAIAKPEIRKSIVSIIKNRQFATIVADDVLIGAETSIGEGSIICSNSIITVNSSIGKHCILDFKTMIGHDVILGDYVTLYPNVTIAGNVKLGSFVEMGTTSKTIQGLSIGSNSIVGAGSTIITDVRDNVTVVGSPAKELKGRN